jgi:hypothetical protein
MTTKPISKAADRVLLSGRARFFAPGEIYGRVRLNLDRIVVSGWTWRGRVERTVPLDAVDDVEWWTLTNDGPNLALLTNNGQRFAFWVKSPGVWRFQIQELLSQVTPEPAKEQRKRLVSAA